MRNIFLGLFFTFLFCPAVFAQSALPNNTSSGTEEFKFRDVPDSHWAAPAVYKLVNLGVTQGYPDGTFRGTKNMTRYETALFMAKLADSLGYAAFEKLGAELKSELKAMQDESSYGKFKISGSFETDIMSSNVFVSRDDPSLSGDKTTIMNYRLIATAVSELDNSCSFKINLDTMDGGYYGGSEKLLSDLLDIEGVFSAKIGLPVMLTATFGPGPVRHLYGGTAFPSEYGRVYVRPYPGIKLSSKISVFEAELGYFAHKVNASDPVLPGEVGVNRINGKILLPFDKIPVMNSGSVAVSGDYFYQNQNVSAPVKTNFKPSLLLVSKPFGNLMSSTQIKVGTMHDITRSRLAVIQDIRIKNLFNSRTDIDLGFTLAGSEYLVEPELLDQWSFLGYDPFGRPAVNGTRRISLNFKKALNDSLAFTGRGNLDLSTGYKFGSGEDGSRLTLEGGLVFSLGKDSDISLCYRSDRDPNAAVQNTDLVSMALSGRF